MILHRPDCVVMVELFRLKLFDNRARFFLRQEIRHFVERLKAVILDFLLAHVARLAYRVERLKLLVCEAIAVRAIVGIILCWCRIIFRLGLGSTI